MIIIIIKCKFTDQRGIQQSVERIQKLILNNIQQEMHHHILNLNLEDLVKVVREALTKIILKEGI